MSRVTSIVSIAGSDSSAGAGIQADIKMATAMNAWCCTAITAITAQNSGSVSDIHVLPGSLLQAQLQAIFAEDSGIQPQAVKIGMLGSAENVLAVAAFLKTREGLPVVLDPLGKATTGKFLNSSPVLTAVIQHLFPLATLLTPNLDEAASLLKCEVAKTLDDMRQQAESLLTLGVNAVLLKGGHLPGPHSIDILQTSEGQEILSAAKIDSSHTHGSGCSLASGIAVGLARDLALHEAALRAKTHVSDFIKRASQGALSTRNGPLIHFNVQ